MNRFSLPSLAGACLLLACSSDGTNGSTGDGDGGAPASGGLQGSGGLPSSGGGVGTGGTPLATGGGLGSGGASGGDVGDTGGVPGTGGDPGSGGDPGTGGAPPAENYTLSEAGGLYTYSAGNSSMTIDPTNGGRVTSFVVEGEETLVQPGGDAEQDGSTFWPSPQSLFDWPPPPEIDSGEYMASATGDELVLTSAEAVSIGLQVTKTFLPTSTPSGTPAISTTYTMTNTGASDIDVAGWEISRVGPGGMAFYPTGPGDVTAQGGLMVTNSGAHSWYLYTAESAGTLDPPAPDATPKVFADGADGWLAWSTGNAVVIKSFSDVAQGSAAPGEGEIELYANQDGTYFEVEQQGPLQTVTPGESATWTVLWVGVTIPDGADTSVGSADLVQAVTGAL